MSGFRPGRSAGIAPLPVGVQTLVSFSPGRHAEGVADHEQHGSPTHPGGHHHMPAGQQACVVHVCCAHLNAPPPTTPRGEEVIALHAAPGFLPAAYLRSDEEADEHTFKLVAVTVMAAP